MNKTVSSSILSDLMKSPAHSNSSGINGPLGGYFKYNNFNDALVQYALDFVAGYHPNMVNYELK